MILCAFIIPALTLASAAQNYGLGGSTSGRANSITAELENPYAALYNPAVISAAPKGLFAFNTGIQETRFASTENLKLANRSLSTWSLGFSYPFRLNPEASHPRHAGLGIALSGPYEKLRSFNAYRPEDPFVMRYGGSDSQFKATVSSSLEILREHLYVGGGLSIYLSTAGNAEEDISGKNPNGRLALDVGLNTAVVAGLFGHWERTQFAFVFHQKIDPTFVQAIDGKVAIGGSDTLHQPVIARSTLYYEPHSFEWELQYDLGPLKTSFGINYELWKSYKAPILLTEATDSDGGKRSTQVYAVPLRNTWNPRVSVEIPFWNRRLSLATGYQFRPTPVEDLSGPANFLDTSAHVFGVSLSHLLRSNEIIPLNLKWGLYAQYHFLNSRSVQKAENPGSDKPSSYVFRGNAAVYGISLQTEL